MKRYLLLCVLGFGVVSSSADAAPLYRQEAIRIALEHNLSLQSGLIQYQAAAAAISEAQGLYDPRLQFLLQTAKIRSAQNFTPLDPSENGQQRLDFSLLKKLPSGADLVAEINQVRDDSLQTTTAYDPSWRHEFQLSLTQPLLKGFGRMTTEEPILLATKGRDSALATVTEEATRLVFDLRSLFADLRRAVAILTSRRASVGLAESILAENQAKVRTGLLPPLDLLEAEVALKNRQRELLDAEQAEEELRDRLAEQLYLDAPPEILLDEFQRSVLVFAEEADLAYALIHRPELRRAEVQVESRRIEAVVADKKRRPALDLVASYGQKGLGGDYGESLDQAVQDDLQSWSIGLTFNYPLGNRQAEGEVARKKLLADNAGSEVLRLRAVVRRELRTAHRQIRLGELRLEVASEGVILADEKLKNLLKRREVGLATTRAIFEGETDLARAQIDRADAEALYDIAITSYLRACGRLLEDEGIRLSGQPDTPFFARGTAN